MRTFDIIYVKRVFPGGGLHPQPLVLAPTDSKSAANILLFSDIQVVSSLFFLLFIIFLDSSFLLNDCVCTQHEYPLAEFQVNGLTS